MQAILNYTNATYQDKQSDIIVPAKALSGVQAKQIFGQDQTQDNIYPVEISIANDSDNTHILTKPSCTNFNSLENNYYVTNVVQKAHGSF
jgi:hypothetical protein